MIREYTCPSCGSNLSLIQGKTSITACENAQEKCDAAEAMMEEMMKETYPRIERLEKELFDTETAQ